jgi:hypothetical protein
VKREASETGTKNASRFTHDASRDSETTELGRLKEQQQAWETFAACAVQMIPVLIKQMETVTQQTERAAVELMVQLRAMTPPIGTSRFNGASPHLSKIVMAMQFQDITRQQLEHVAQALGYWRTHLQGLLKGPQDEGAKKEIAVLQQLEQTYTMDMERRLHASVLLSDYQEPELSEAEQVKQGPESVTLF